MLIEFSVENFRSIAARQTLSLSAGRFRSERIGAVMDSDIRGTPNVLRALAVMGANGSGKSTIFHAISFVQYLVENSAQGMQKGESIPVHPHRLDEAYIGEPSSFEVIFLHESIQYTYAISATRRKIVSECLHSRARGKSLNEVFSRRIDNSGQEIWNLGSLPRENAKLWQESTRENALFLSTAVQLNSEDLAAPYEWFAEQLRVLPSSVAFSNSLTSHLIKDHVEDGCRAAILNMIREADLGVRDVLVKEVDFDESHLPSDVPDELRRRMIDDLRDSTYYETEFEHRTKGGELVSFDLDDESDGTQKLYEIAGPIITALRHNFTLMIDEIDTSLHPFVVRFIIQMFQNPSDSSCKAQLIFSSHDDGLLDAQVLERDQFVFVEKRAGASEIVPLIEYKPRKGESMRANYLRGRYGGVPAISRVKVF